jgi:hypothetical protein
LVGYVSTGCVFDISDSLLRMSEAFSELCEECQRLEDERRKKRDKKV